MIVKSRVTGKYVLEVFENFQTDRTLPKHAKPRASSGILSVGDSKYANFNMAQDGDDMSESEAWSNTVSNWGSKTPVATDWRSRLMRGLGRLLRVSKRAEPVSGREDPLRILLSVRGSLKEAQDYAARLTTYDEVIRQAVCIGQKARAEKLMLARKVVEIESRLIVAGYKQYLTEDQVVDFAMKCQKGLRLDWVANFIRSIPETVVSRKTDADGLKVFDNYVVLHYDPKVQAFALTQEQEIAKKDPILFGVIEGVRKLYFIGDWKDDECSLTMEEVSSVLGQPVGEISTDPTRE